MEKLKDLLHDFTDILLAIVIAFAMFAVVSLYLGDWFQTDKNIVVANEQTPDDTVPVTPEVEDSEEEAPEDNTSQEEEEAPSDTEAPEDEGNEEEAAPPVTVVEVKTITIPNGTPGVGIATILLENGLIENTADFINTAENLSLSLKLKSGTFEIPTDATIEEMVKIIAKQN